jgi:hypothetical protein
LNEPVMQEALRLQLMYPLHTKQQHHLTMFLLYYQYTQFLFYDKRWEKKKSVLSGYAKQDITILFFLHHKYRRSIYGSWDQNHIDNPTLFLYHCLLSHQNYF